MTERAAPGGRSLAGPVRLAALSFDGERILASFATKQIHLLDGEARELTSLAVERSVAALAMGALADGAVIGLSGGTVLGVEIRG